MTRADDAGQAMMIFTGIYTDMPILMPPPAVLR